MLLVMIRLKGNFTPRVLENKTVQHPNDQIIILCSGMGLLMGVPLFKKHHSFAAFHGDDVSGWNFVGHQRNIA